jgi:hypothetical protein
VLNLPLLGAPEYRHHLLLLSLLEDRGKLLRFLLLLLAGTGLDAGTLINPIRTHNRRAPNGQPAFGHTLLESLINALDQNPQRLDQIARLVADLRETPEGHQLLPEGFDAIWEPVWAARQGLTR